MAISHSIKGSLRISLLVVNYIILWWAIKEQKGEEQWLLLIVLSRFSSYHQQKSKTDSKIQENFWIIALPVEFVCCTRWFVESMLINKALLLDYSYLCESSLSI